MEVGRELTANDAMLRLTLSLERGQPPAWDDVITSDHWIDFQLVDIRGGSGKLPEWKVYGIPGLIIEWGINLLCRDIRLVSAAVYKSRSDLTARGANEISFLMRVM